MQGIWIAFSRAGVRTGLTDRSPEGRRRFRRGLIGLGAYCCLILAMMVAVSPFSVGIDRIAEMGDWNREDVAMIQGSYGYRFLFAVAEVDAWVDTPTGRVPARVEMVLINPFSWSVKSFEIGTTSETLSN
ncbi:MAG: hypothetical protein GKS06_05885 [Acidobacteria bacterium]|nr:hypothetical protein [Acidobacteriota bacterium]